MFVAWLNCLVFLQMYTMTGFHFATNEKKLRIPSSQITDILVINYFYLIEIYESKSINIQRFQQDFF